jgi:nitronate monooxygenase
MRGEQTTDAARRLGVRHPIIQGPFGGGLSTTRLAAVVSNMGGLGSYGAQSLTPSAIGPVVDEIRSLTPHPFAVNLWVSDDTNAITLSAAEFDRVARLFEPYFRDLGITIPAQPQQFDQRFGDQVDALLEANPPAFSFIFGVPSPAILAECARRGIVTIGTATSVDEARLLDAAGVDVIVATGSEAGGHRPSFLAPAEESLMGTFALTQLVAPRVKAPVVAAGGIVDARGVRAAIALGAQGAQIGSAFLACEESGTTPEHRAALFSERVARTTLTRAFSGRLARTVRHRWTDEIAPTLKDLPPYPLMRWFTSQLRAAAVKAGRTDIVPLYAGQAAPNLRHTSAAALMTALLEE